MADGLAPVAGIPLTDSQKISWLRLSRSENIGPATFLELMKRYLTAEKALEALPELVARGKGKRIRIASIEQAEAEFEKLSKMGGQLICVGEPNYPNALRAVDTPPPVLSILGSPDCLKRNAVGFVGSRNASLAGIKLTRKLSKEVADAGYLTVSGLARGIDSAAHEATVVNGTVAAFAGGLDYVYPPENYDLAKSIIDNEGALVSEMPLGWQPRARDFPRRNRIVAGMCLGVVVVEAARRSGSLITARLANELGRLVFAVPGSPLDPRSDGANQLIKQGAQLITSSGDIVDAIEPLTVQKLQHSYTLDDDSVGQLEDDPNDSDREKLIAAIGHTPTDIDELIRFTGISAGTIQILLLELDLAGRLERLPGNRVSLN